jgi:bacillithiol synthase
MESTCIRHADLGGSKLFLDYLYHFDKVSRFYPWAPLEPASYREAIGRIHYPEERRAALVEALSASNAGNPSLEVLARPGTVAVVTGQQVGLFSGPAYTIYKALSAIRLVRRLTEMGHPAVPVFWLATEDHDLEEVRSCWVFGSDGAPAELTARAVAGGPVGPIRAEFPVGGLRAALESFPFGDEAAGLAAAAYGTRETLGSAFRKLLEGLFGRYGLLTIDPLEPGIKRLAAPLLAEAVERMDELTGALEARSAELEAAGYHVQVRVDPQSSLAFLLEDGGRYPMRRKDGGFLCQRRQLSARELIREPERLSPNALLRPVVQDYLLPTAGFVVGAAELAYLGQAGVLYDRLLGRMPVIVPRQGFTLLSARQWKLFARYKLSLKDFAPGEAHLRERIAAALVPPEIWRSLERTGTSVRAALEKLEGDLAAFDPTLAAATAKSRAKIGYQVQKIAAKTGRELFRREQRLDRETRELYDRVYPQRHLQERVYTILPFLAQHGLDLPERLLEHMNPNCHDHQLIAL